MSQIQLVQAAEGDKKPSDKGYNKSLLHSFTILFYICKILGIYPHDIQSFRERLILQKSKTGTWFVIAVMICIVVCFNLMIISFKDETFRSTLNKLSLVISIVLTYIGPTMVVVDMITVIRNQQKLNVLFDKIADIDQRMRQVNIMTDNRSLRSRINLMIFMTIMFETMLFISTYILLTDHIEYQAILWIFSVIPTFYNSLDKIWFVGLLLALRERFQWINKALDSIVAHHERVHSDEAHDEEELMKSNLHDDIRNSDDSRWPRSIDEIEHFTKVMKTYGIKNKVAPVLTIRNYFGELIENPQKFDINIRYNSELDNVQAIEDKFIIICQLHDSICSVAKMLNELWSYPLLILMAYGFIIFTAQLYFYYCSAVDQPIPSIFQQAKEIKVTLMYLAYITGKCVSIIFWSWKTTLESKRTGICLHKCAVSADRNEIYEIVNHLSLKLLNHVVDFSACGFFNLNMETLFAVCGGITSYLIILIQFNMAGQQVRSNNNGNTAVAAAAALTMGMNDTQSQSLHDSMFVNGTNYFYYIFFVTHLSV